MTLSALGPRTTAGTTGKEDFSWPAWEERTARQRLTGSVQVVAPLTLYDICAGPVAAQAEHEGS